MLYRRITIAGLLGVALLVGGRTTSADVPIIRTSFALTANAGLATYAPPASLAMYSATATRLTQADMDYARGDGWWSKIKKWAKKAWKWVRENAGWIIRKIIEEIIEEVIHKSWEPAYVQDVNDYYQEDIARDEYYETDYDLEAGVYSDATQSSSGTYYTHTTYGGGGGGGGGCETGCDPY